LAGNVYGFIALITTLGLLYHNGLV